MEKVQLWTIIGIILVVVFITSITTASITGNVVKLNNIKDGNYSVYTISETYNKLEIDSKLRGINAGIDSKLSDIASTPENCIVHSFSSNTYPDGNTLCANQTANKCLIGQITITATNNVTNTTTNKTTAYGVPTSTTAYGTPNLVFVYPKFFTCSENFAGIYNKTIPGLIITKEYQVICCD